MGRSRGGLTTKIHVLVDACGLPIMLKLTEGQAHDPNKLRDTLEARGVWANVKPMPHRLNPPKFSKRLYRERNLVERFFDELKHFRAVATRYDKRDDNYLASGKLASIRIWLRFNEPVT